MELLSPAGDLDCVKAAVTNGADSIYLGTKLFNARRLASNFTDESLPQAVLYCKMHGVKVYLTSNTLVRNEELKLWFEQIKKAYEAGIHGIILQDMSLIPLLRKYFPNLEIHASTQASFMNYHGINTFPDFDLYVLARELKKDEVIEIRKRVHKRLEMFVHGHLCISYSGQCLISSLIGHRSGNRGICASSCRKPYNDKGYLISPRDLMMANNIDELYDIGIDCIKIEGRMKSAEYVAITTRTYRTQIDDAKRHRMKHLTQTEIANLKMGFNRNFTPGLFEVKSIIDPEMPMNRGIPLGTVNYGTLRLEHDIEIEDGISFWDGGGSLEGGTLHQIMTDNGLVTSAKRGETVKLPFKQFKNGVRVFLTYQNTGQKVIGNKVKSLHLIVTGKPGENLKMIDSNGRFEVASSIPLQEAKNQALTKEVLLKKINKLLPTEIQSFNVQGFMPMTILNDLADKYEKKVQEALIPQRIVEPITVPTFPAMKFNSTKIIVKVYSLEQLKEALECNVDIIYYDVFSKDLEAAKKMCTAKFFIDTPVILSDRQIDKIQEILDRIKPDGIVIGNWGMLDVNFPGEKHGKYSLNTFNDFNMNMLLEKGVIPMFSIELSFKQLTKFQIKKGIYYAHGRIPVMHFKGELDEDDLKDEKGYSFPLRFVGGNTEMLYSRPIATFERIKELEGIGINHYFLDLEVKTKSIIQAYQNIINCVKQDISYLKKGTTIKNFDKGVA